MGGSDLGSLIRLQSRCQLGLQSSEGFPGARGPTLKPSILSIWVFPQGCSDVLVTWQLASSRKSNPSAQGRSLSTFYELASEVKYHPFPHAYCSHGPALPDSPGRRLHWDMNPRRLGSSGSFVEAGRHILFCFALRELVPIGGSSNRRHWEACRLEKHSKEEGRNEPKKIFLQPHPLLLLPLHSQLKPD